MELIHKIIAIVVVLVAIVLVTIPIIDYVEIDSHDTIDVVLIDGQSNGAYYTNNLNLCNPLVATEHLDKPSHRAYYYGTEEGSSREIGADTKIRSMYGNGHWLIGGEEAGLAYYLMEKNHKDVLVLNIAKPSMGIHELATGETWTKGRAVVVEALEQIEKSYSKVNIIGWVMIHGEADRNQTVSYYESNFMILKNNLSALGFKQCYFSLPRYVWGLNAYDAMIDLADRYPDVHVATAITDTFTVENGLLYVDELHYTQLGRLVLSEAVVDYLPTDSAEGELGLIGVIPILLIVGVIIMAVRLFYLKATEWQDTK